MPERQILGISGGKDSAALAVFLHGKIPDLEYFFCDTGKELKEDMEAEGEEFPLNVVPFLYLGFGIKGVVTNNIHLLVEGAILDGFVLRAGVAVRF